MPFNQTDANTCILKMRQPKRIPCAHRMIIMFSIRGLSKTTLQIYESVFFSCIKNLSRLLGKPTIYIGENKDADQLRGYREADQRLCFRYSDSTIPLLLKSEISSFYLFSVTVQAGLCQTCSKTTSFVFPRDGSFISHSA